MLALVVGVGLGLGLDRVLPLQTVLWTADLQALPEWAGAQGEATVVQDRRGNKTLRIKMTSPKPVDGDRQVWVADRGVCRACGRSGSSTRDSQSFALPRDFTYEEFPIVDVSDEPADDTEPRHSGDLDRPRHPRLRRVESFRKHSTGHDRDYFAIEAAGLRWLADAGPGCRPDRVRCSTSATTTSSWSGSPPSEPNRRRPRNSAGPWP